MPHTPSHRLEARERSIEGMVLARFQYEFLNFSTSRSRLDLAGRSVINEIEVGDEENLGEYYTPGSGKYVEMIDRIRQRLRLTTLQYQKLDDLVQAIGLPKEKLCTHCWDNSSYF